MAPFDLALVLETVEQLGTGELSQVPRHATKTFDRFVEATLGDSSLEHRTDALRAWTDVVEWQLVSLTAAENELPPGFWGGARQLRSFRDLGELLSGPLSDLRALCSQPLPLGHEVEPRVQAMRTLAIAEKRAMRLGRNPELACVLAAAASITPERVRRASRALAALLGLSLAPLFIAVPHSAAPSADEDACLGTPRRSMVR